MQTRYKWQINYLLTKINDKSSKPICWPKFMNGYVKYVFMLSLLVQNENKQINGKVSRTKNECLNFQK